MSKKIFIPAILFCCISFNTIASATALTGTTTLIELNVREGPGETFKTVNKLPKASKLTAVGRNKDASWLKVRIPETTTIGWVSSDFVKINDDVNSLPVVEISALTSATLAAASRTSVLEIPLYKLAPVRSMDLKCIQGEAGISVPIPDRWKILKASVSIAYTNSANLMGDRSQLAIKFNDRIIGQMKLNPLSPEGRLELSIPSDLIKNSYNSLGIAAVQHYSKDCEQFCSPDLWTTVNLDNSFLKIEYNLKDVPLKLSDISNFLFDPKIFPNGEVNIIAKDISSEWATMAGIAASGIARRFDYRKTLFTVSPDIKQGYDNVLIGSKGFVEDFLKQKGIEIGIPGPFLKIMPLPNRNGEADRSHGMLIVSGVNANDVKIAAETLANITMPYPGADEMIIKEFRLPDISLYSGRRILTADKTYLFKKLNFNTHTFQGFNPNPREITFRLPADFLIKQNQYARMILNFSYGAGMRSDSALNVTLNDKSVRVIHLNNINGDYIEKYKIELPTYLFKPGSNTIKFAPVLNPVAKECDLLRQDGYFLTIFENSTFYFPAMPHFIEMPNLELFTLDGFPFTRWPDGYESMIYLTQSDYNTVNSALNLIGLITQKNGYPLFGAEITFKKPDNYNGELIILGDIKTIPEDFAKNAPLKFAKESSVPYPVIRSWDTETSFAFSKQISNIGSNTGAAMEFESPYKKGRSVLLLTGASTKDLSSLSRALLEPAVQVQMGGDLMLVDLSANPDYRVKTISAGQKYYAGKSGKISAIEYYLFKYPYIYYLTVALIVLVLSLTLFYLLKRYRRKRMPDVE